MSKIPSLWASIESSLRLLTFLEIRHSWKGLEYFQRHLDFFRYMYWLNKLQKRIERAWLNGRHLDRHPFHEDLPPENISVTTGLTLDIPSRRLYFIRTRIHNTLSEIVSCDFYNRTSCKVVIDNIRAYHMNVYGEYLFWTSIDGNHEGVRFCQKDNCRKSVGVIVNTSSVDVFRVFHEDVQPESKAF